MTPSQSTEAALRYSAQHQQRHLEELMAFLRIPSVSTQPERTDAVRQAARWLGDAMAAAGLENVRVIETARHPLVYADWLHAGEDAPTVLIYGHYDVQPAEPLDLWQTPPFEPEVRDNYLYARGSSDDKGQVHIHVKAVEAYLRGEGALPVNVKFVVEGEEESGGESLAAFVPRNRELLNADVVLISDSAMMAAEQPTIIYGLRGIVYLLVDVDGPGRDLHSGAYGGGINNPINALAHIIAQLKDGEGHILIPGFYDNVRPLSEEERELMGQAPFDEQSWLAEAGAPAAWGEAEYTILERTGARPTLDVNGIIGGYTGSGGKTIIPAHAHAKISMRLVPDQDPERIERLFRDYVAELTPESVSVNISATGASAASVNDYDTPAVNAAAAAYEAVFGKEPVLKREGGSIPVVGEFQQELGLESVLMGFGLPDDKIHAPNERFYLPNFYRGIETVIHFFAEYGARAEREDEKE